MLKYIFPVTRLNRKPSAQADQAVVFVEKDRRLIYRSINAITYFVNLF